jgi:hypothetical protein
MARAAYVVLCIAGMLGFVLLAKWGAHHFSEDAVAGFGLGVISTLITYNVALKIEQREKSQRDRA